MTIVKYLIIWIGLAILAIINGILRNEVYAPYVSELSAHQISTITALLIFSLFIWIVSAYWKISNNKDAILICVIWLSISILFEFIFGHYVMGHPWSVLLHDYNIFKGRLWVLILIWTAMAPYIVYKLRNKT